MTLNALPQPIAIDKEDAENLIDLAQSLNAIQNWVDLVQQQAERNLVQYREDTQRIWQELDEKYDLNIKQIQWVPSEDRKTIIPVAVKLANTPGAGKAAQQQGEL